jgi:hypothetical protein
LNPSTRCTQGAVRQPIGHDAGRHFLQLIIATARRLIDAHLTMIRLDCPANGGTTVTAQVPACAG